MGNLGRAGYGASLDGMVSISKSTVKFVLNCESSGRILMIPVMLVRVAVFLARPISNVEFVGTVANQTVNGQPQAATVNGDKSTGGVLSYLPGTYSAFIIDFELILYRSRTTVGCISKCILCNV
jgi:hypothetical protein